MARQKILIVSQSSVARALLSSLLDPGRFEAVAADSLPAALRQLAIDVPHVAIVQADLVRGNADAIERIRAAAGASLPVVLADRGYSDERRAASEARSFRAGAFVPIPTDASTLEDALRAAAVTRPRPASGPPITLEDTAEQAIDAALAARFAERLASQIDAMDAYQVLRVARTATASEIDASFRQRALEYHPDRQHDLPDEQARENLYRIFKRISWAHRQIGDPAARRQYDAVLDARK